MTGLGNSLLEAEIQRHGQRWPEVRSELSNLATAHDNSRHSAGSSQDTRAQEDSTKRMLKTRAPSLILNTVTDSWEALVQFKQFS